MRIHQVSNFSSFHRIMSQYNSRNIIFRGVKDVSHKLIPKIGRPKQHIYGDLIEYELKIMDLFRKFSQPYLKDLKSSSNEWELLAIAQHHGLPTRLLDWTRNPMVAAFFAVKDLHGGDSVVYALDSSTLNTRIDEYESPYEVQEVLIFEPSHINSRIISQNGVFTVPHIVDQPLNELDNFEIAKIIIKKQFREELKCILSTYGINKATLFPDLDGLTEYLDWFTTKQQ